MPIDLSTLDGRALIQVRDRADIDLPFSKGIMATSLLATGMPTDQAYRIAAGIAKTLHASGEKEVRADRLAEIAAKAVEEGAGPVFARRYEAWRQAKRLGLPLVICLAGPPGVGKSTIATRLALRLGINRVVTTDAIREVLRTVIPTAVLPELHVSSYQRVEVGPMKRETDGFALQMRAVSAATAAVARRMATEARSVILEGVHLLPGAISRQLREEGSRAIVVERLLTLSDEHIHEGHLRRRLRDVPERNGEGHLAHFAEVRAMQEELRSIAWQEGVREQDIAHPEDLTQNIVDEVTSHAVEEAGVR